MDLSSPTAGRKSTESPGAHRVADSRAGCAVVRDKRWKRTAAAPAASPRLLPASTRVTALAAAREAWWCLLSPGCCQSGAVDAPPHPVGGGVAGAAIVWAWLPRGAARQHRARGKAAPALPSQQQINAEALQPVTQYSPKPYSPAGRHLRSRGGPLACRPRPGHGGFLTLTPHRRCRCRSPPLPPPPPGQLGHTTTTYTPHRQSPPPQLPLPLETAGGACSCSSAGKRASVVVAAAAAGGRCTAAGAGSWRMRLPAPTTMHIVRRRQRLARLVSRPLSGGGDLLEPRSTPLGA